MDILTKARSVAPVVISQCYFILSRYGDFLRHQTARCRSYVFTTPTHIAYMNMDVNGCSDKS